MSVQKVSVREARQYLRRLLDQVQGGDEIVVLRRGTEVARFVGPRRKNLPFPDLSSFRASIKIQGRAMSEEVKEARRSSR